MLSQKQLNELEKAIDREVEYKNKWRENTPQYIYGFEVGMRKMLERVCNIGEYGEEESNERI